MRFVLLFIAVFLLPASLISPADAATSVSGIVQRMNDQPTTRRTPFKSAAELVNWIHTYRDNPQPLKVPDAIHALHRHGMFEDLDRAGLYIGFLAGVIGDNQILADKIIRQLFPMPPKQQAVIIQAIAYSGLPNWKDLLKKYKERLFARTPLMEKFLSGGHKPLYEASLDQSPDILDALWGTYIATGYFQPIQRILLALEWTDDTKNTDRYSVAHMALWSLAANAETDFDLMGFYKEQLPHQSKKIAKSLKEVISTAEQYKAYNLKKEVITRIAVQNRRKPPSKYSKWAWPAKAGEVLLSVGCVAATALGQGYLAAPCVVTGAVYSGVRKLLMAQ